MVKNLPISAGDMGLIPRSGRCPEGGNGNLLQYSCQENSMGGEVWRATVLGGHKDSDPTEHNSTQQGQEPNKRPQAVPVRAAVPSTKLCTVTQTFKVLFSQNLPHPHKRVSHRPRILFSLLRTEQTLKAQQVILQGEPLF